MKTYVECFPCIVRHAVEAAHHAGNDSGVAEQVLREVLDYCARLDMSTPPPKSGQFVNQVVRRISGLADPYLEVKQRFNAFILGLYPSLKTRIELSAHPLETAIRMAIAGNIIDYGLNSHFHENDVLDTVEKALTAPLYGEVAPLVERVHAAKDILYLADNAGEIVFDRLLIEFLPMERITLAVRGRPVLNDVLRADAEQVGLTRLVEVIDNGSDAPGTLLDECSPEFRRRFEQADVIIAKGQGNYETLSESTRDIFFLLKAKCPVVARYLGCPMNGMVLRRSGGR